MAVPCDDRRALFHPYSQVYTQAQTKHSKQKGAVNRSNLIIVRKSHQEDSCDIKNRKERLIEDWRDKIRRTFPDLHHRTYILPAVHFNRVSHSERITENGTIKIPQPDLQMSDVREDEVQRRVHNALDMMFKPRSDMMFKPRSDEGLTKPSTSTAQEPEAMFILFGLSFDNYLNNSGNATESEGGQSSSQADPGHASLGERRIPGLPRKFSPVRFHGRHPTTRNTNSHHSDDIQFKDWRTRGGIVPSNDVTSSVEPTPAETDLSIFPRPRDLETSLQRGRFDILMIHRKYGLFVLEVKAVGDMFKLPTQNLEAARDMVKPSTENQNQLGIIRRRVEKSLKQLDKNEAVLRYLLEDAAQAGIPITKVLVLPNLTRQVVLAALNQDPSLCQSFCRSFQTETVEKALNKCVFSEQLPSIGQTVTTEDDVIEDLRETWWLPLVNNILTSPFTMNDKLYESIVARFCGPATKQYVSTAHNPRADVSTLSKAVLETAHCFSAPMLTEDQLSILDNRSPRVYLTGPPGTGKTTLLMLKAKEWLKQPGHTVIFVSLWQPSDAAVFHLHHKVKQEMASAEDRLFYMLNKGRTFANFMTDLEVFFSEHSFLHRMSDPRGHVFTQRRHEKSKVSWADSSSDDEQNSSYSSSDWYVQFTVGAENDRSGNSTEDDPDPRLRHPGKEVRTESGLYDCSPTSLPGRQYPAKKHFTTPQSRSRAGFTDLHRSIPKEPTRLSNHRLGYKKPEDLHQRKVHIIVEEAPWFLNRFLQALETFLEMDRLVVWAASSLPHFQLSGFTHFEMTRILQRPPVVVRQMITTPAYGTFQRAKYTSQEAGVLSSMPYPTDGPPVKRIQHHTHEKVEIWDCEKCGEAVAAFLTNDLQIGKGRLSKVQDDTLCFSHVLISGHLPSLRDFANSTSATSTDSMDIDKNGNDDIFPPRLTSPNPHSQGFLGGLTKHDIKFEILAKDEDNGFRCDRLAVPPCTDRVQIAGPDIIKGLARPVVVILEASDVTAAAPCYVDPSFDVMACCTSQLVIVGDPYCNILEKRPRI